MNSSKEEPTTSKLFSVSLRYNVIEEHTIRASSVQEAEEKVLEMAQGGELTGGNITDSELDEVDEVWRSRELKDLVSKEDT